MTTWTSWIPPEALASALEGDRPPVVLDARFLLADPTAGRRAWREGHVPGAIHADLDRDLSGPHRPGAGRHPWPDAAALRARLGQWGIEPGTPVAVYDAAGGALAAARAWFLLRALGHRAVAVLDGGWAAWRDKGLPVEAGEAGAGRAAPAYPGHFAPGLLLDPEGVQAHLAGGGLLLDARAPERYRGDVEPIDRIGGHVPGAINRPCADNLRDGLAKAPEALRLEFDALLRGRDPASVVVMCGSGVTACHHLLAMTHAGLPPGRLFAGSWSGWIEDPERPVGLGPAP